MYYIATFYSHFGAIRFKRECRQEGREAQLMPVPRDLSSSCGTCVRFMDNEDYLVEKEIYMVADAYEEIEQIVRETERGYEVIYDGR